jgi:hypothetical protein
MDINRVLKREKVLDIWLGRDTFRTGNGNGYGGYERHRDLSYVNRNVMGTFGRTSKQVKMKTVYF